MPRSSKRSPPFTFSGQNFVLISPLPIRATRPYHLNLFDLIILLFGEGYKLYEIPYEAINYFDQLSDYYLLKKDSAARVD
jgi:hypothetical protein